MSEPRKRPESRRLRAAGMFAKGTHYLEVASALGVSDEAARKWFVRWQDGGKAALKERKDAKRGPKSPLSDEDTHALMREAKKQKVETIAGICQLAEKRKLSASRAAVRRKLIALGYWPAGKGD